MEKKTIMGVVIAAVMVFSVFAVVLDRYGMNSGGHSYNSYTFTQGTTTWQFDYKGKQLEFTFVPEQTEITNLTGDIAAVLKNNKAFIVTYDINSTLATAMAQMQYKFEQVVNNNIQAYVSRGLTTETEYVLPKITCANATPTTPVIYLKEGDERKISLENNCIIAQAPDSSDVIAEGERMLYTMLGVMN